MKITIVKIFKRDHKHPYKKIFGVKDSFILFKKALRRLSPIGLTILVVLLCFHCEGNDRYYRPNLPGIICIIGMIDIDTSLSYFSYRPYPWLFPEISPEFLPDSNSTRSISFEKSYQIEYPEELTDSLREFEFTISSSGGTLFNYQNNRPLQRLFRFELADSIIFSSGEKYYIEAKEKDLHEISAEIVVPEPPSVPDLISVEKEPIVLSKPLDDCWGGIDTLKSVVIRFSFKKNNERRQYYAIIVDGIYRRITPQERFFGYLDFSLRESNSTGFFAPWHGLYVRHYPRPPGGYYLGDAAPVSAYFIDGSKIPGEKCEITVSTQFHGPLTNSNYLWEKYYSVRIKLLSIPEELYLFEKSLYTYGKIKKDPFSEPVLLNGNIKGGNGVFAICRSTELIVNFSPPY